MCCTHILCVWWATLWVCAVARWSHGPSCPHQPGPSSGCSRLSKTEIVVCIRSVYCNLKKAYFNEIRYEFRTVDHHFTNGTTEQVSIAVTLYICMRKVLCFNYGREWDILWYCSVSSAECRDRLLPPRSRPYSCDSSCHSTLHKLKKMKQRRYVSKN
jgi:hypothetical protein